MAALVLGGIAASLALMLVGGGMAETMPIDRFLIISPFVQYGIIAALIACSVYSARRLKRLANEPAPISRD